MKLSTDIRSERLHIGGTAIIECSECSDEISYTEYLTLQGKCESCYQLTHKEKKTMAKKNVTTENPEKEIEKTPFQLVPLNTGRRKTILVSLNSLIKLDKTDIRHARYAMREVNQQHVEHLMYSFMAFDPNNSDEKFPPLKVVGTTWGNAVIDGNHRWQAIEKALKNAFEGEELEHKRSEFQIEVEPLNGLTERQIIKAAFEANKKNGLPMSRDSCSRYGMWLMEDAKENGEKMSQHEAARIAGCSQSAISQMIAKEKNRQNKMIDDFVTSEEDKETIESQIEEKEEKQEEDKMQSSAKKLFSAIRFLGDTTDDVQALADYLQQFADTDHRDNAHIVSQALELVYKQLDLIAVSMHTDVVEASQDFKIGPVDIPEVTYTDDELEQAVTDSDGVIFDFN